MLPLRLIVGLANPGKNYAETRHNAGGWFVENIAKAAKIMLRQDFKFHGWLGSGNIDGQPCYLLIPSTYMNESGKAVRAVMQYYKIEPESVLIAHDELDLNVGTVKLKCDGGDGGHNGLKDVIRHLHTKQFNRLRIGIGRPAHNKEVIDYVLHPPSKADRIEIDLGLAQAQAVLPLLLKGEISKAMQALHTLPQ
ncbi:MAG: aminoacyl-tRNA hydrolase [Gammaproteobacteria bacterium]|nr:aminoacyl-tRNA hydrolase [Gammaproteobacteria bacterium]